jgi:hypothetical protein
VNSAEIEVENDITQEQPKDETGPQGGRPEPPKDENGNPMAPPKDGPKRR